MFRPIDSEAIAESPNLGNYPRKHRYSKNESHPSPVACSGTAQTIGFDDRT
jgi:hypothetical protein